MPAPRVRRPSSPDSHCGSPPPYQAMVTPTHTPRELEVLVDRVVRGHSHSHALSAILGATTPASASTSFDWRPSNQAQLNPTSSMQLRENEKTESPWIVANWRQWRRRGKKGRGWSIALVVFVACFLLTFATPTQAATVAPLVVGSVLSLVSTVVVLGSFLKRRRRRRRPNELLAFAALSEFGLATLTLIHVAALCSATDGACRSLALAPCTVSVGLELFLLLTGIGWFGAAILHLFVSISNPFASYKRQLVLYHLVVWGVSLLASAIVPIIVFSEHTQSKYQLTETELCRMVALVLPFLPGDANESSANKRRRLLQWQDLNVAFYGVLAAIVVLTILAAQFSLVVGWWRANSGTIIALKARRRLLKRMTVYVHAFTGMWLVLVAVFCIYRSTPRALEYIQVDGASVPLGGDARNALHACFHFLVTGKGFVTSVVWLSVNHPCCVLELVCCGLHHCTTADEDPSLGRSASQSASSSESYRDHVRDDHAHVPCATTVPLEPAQVVQAPPLVVSPTLPVPTVGHANAGGSALEWPQHHHSLPTLSSVFDPLSTARASRLSSSCDASTVESFEASPYNETLQREIMYYTVCGITKAISQSTERARVSREATRTGPRDVSFAADDRDGGLVEIPLVARAQDPVVYGSCRSHVHRVRLDSSPRAPRGPLALVPHPSVEALDHGGQCERCNATRPTSWPVSHATCPHSLFPPARPSRGAQGTADSRGSWSLDSVSPGPRHCVDYAMERQRSRSSTEDLLGARAAVCTDKAGRTATSALRQGRGVFSRRRALRASVPGARRVRGPVLAADGTPPMFVEYAPRAFRAIRVAFDLSDEQYLASFRTTAKDRLSAGSSGAFMFFSGDKALLVKSLTEKECRALVEMAPAYARYLAGHPHSRLIRFVGCHRVRLYGRNFYFAVMSNVLYSRGHTATMAETYDVKGSWVDRRARRPQRGDVVTCADCDASYVFADRDDADRADARPGHVHRPAIVWKDADWTRSLHLPRAIAVHLHAQLMLDCAFLHDWGIMDYSLLIGIHKCHVRPGRGACSRRHDVPRCVFEDKSGVNLAPLGAHEVYFVGIIDILQHWDWAKQFEKAGKVLLGKSGRGISAVAPAAYCRRFQARCAQILLGGPGPERVDRPWGATDARAGTGSEPSRVDSRDRQEAVVSMRGTTDQGGCGLDVEALEEAAGGGAGEDV